MDNRFTEPHPVTPGEFLREHVLAGTGITQDALAEAMGVSRFTVNQIINGRRAVTADTAVRLAQVLSTTPDLWLNLQNDVDLWRARRALGEVTLALKVLRRPVAQADFVSLEALTSET